MSEPTSVLPAVVDPRGLDETPDGRLRRFTNAWLRSKPSPRTQEGYFADLKDWLGFVAGLDVHPLVAGRDTADCWADDLRTRVLADGNQLKAATINRRLTAASSWYDYLEDGGLVARNPFRKVARPALSREGTTPALSEPQFRQLLAAAGDADPARRALTYFCFLLGFRVSEACAVDHEDLGEQDGHRTLKVIVKGGREHVVPLPPAVARTIDELAVTQGPRGPVLRRQDGNRLDRQTARRWTVALGKQAGITVTTHPHVGRASGATRLWEQGVPANRIVAWGRWASVQTAERYDRGGKQLDGHAAYLLGVQLLGEAS